MLGICFFGPEQTGRLLFVLEKGSVRTFSTYGDRRLTIAMLQPPTVFGEMSCIGRGSTIPLRKPSRTSPVRMISRASIQALLECAPHVAHKLIDLMSERCMHFLHEMETLALEGLIPRQPYFTELLCVRRRANIKTDCARFPGFVPTTEPYLLLPSDDSNVIRARDTCTCSNRWHSIALGVTW